MKVIVLILLAGISLSYNPDAAISYAKTYCKNFNPNYNNYKYKGGDSANFVSQCLTAGGLNFDGCRGRDDKGMIPNDIDLRSCLRSKGWKFSTTRPPSFRAGYPITDKYYYRTMIVTGIDGNNIFYCDHFYDKCNIKERDRSFYYLYL